ncbi:MAG: hypothetical protein Sapg2KO_12090 [Saprospiraceae bacterium]
MAKKRFTSGMDSLFDETPDRKDLEQDPSSLDKKSQDEQKTSQLDKKNTGKGFSDDLKAFLQEAFEESFDKQAGQTKAPTRKSTRNVKPKQGLDALLRSTIEPSKMRLRNKPVRRLTISFDETKLAKLKNIARQEKTFLKDIIDEIVGEYLASYDKDPED